MKMILDEDDFRGKYTNIISYLVNITCIIARFKPGEYSEEYSPGSEYETVDYTPRGLSKLFIDVTHA